jgi:hypothetical protein
MAILLIEIYGFNTIPMKIPMAFFIEIEKAILKFIWKDKTQNKNKNNPENKSTARDITVPGFTLYYRAIVTKSAQCWHTIRHVDQWDRIEDHK